MVSIKTTVEVTQESIMYQFCAAFEGGSNEWLHSAYWRGTKNQMKTIYGMQMNLYTISG